MNQLAPTGIVRLPTVSHLFIPFSFQRTERPLLISPPRDCNGGPRWSPPTHPGGDAPVLHHGTVSGLSTSTLPGAPRSSQGLGLRRLTFIYVAEKFFGLNTCMLDEVQIPQKTKIILAGMSATKTKCRQATAGEDKQQEGGEMTRTDEGEIFKTAGFLRLAFPLRRKLSMPSPSCLLTFFLLPSLCHSLSTQVATAHPSILLPKSHQH